MTDTLSGLLTIGVLIGLLAVAYVPLGDYMARTYSSSSHTRFEKFTYRLMGVNPDSEQSPKAYAISVVSFSSASILLLMAILMLQAWLPW